jgi:hypothetical protein
MNEAIKILALQKLSRHLKPTGTRSGVAGTPQPERAYGSAQEALERWATHIAGIVALLQESVVSLPRKQGRKMMDERLKTTGLSKEKNASLRRYWRSSAGQR